MKARFNLQQALQATAHLVKLQPNSRLNYTRALKLLYVAERELLAETGSLLTADLPCAMENGPVLSKTYNLIKGRGPLDQQTTWSHYVQSDGYDLLLTNDPGHGELSREIRRKLEEVTKRYERLTGPQLNEATHAFPEWQGHYVPDSNSSFPFDWEEVMAHQGKTPEEIQIACKQEETRHILAEISGHSECCGSMPAPGNHDSGDLGHSIGVAPAAGAGAGLGRGAGGLSLVLVQGLLPIASRSSRAR